MSVDVFGRSLTSNSSSSNRGPPGVGFKLTADGQFNLENKRLCNVASATHTSDAVNLETLQRVIQNVEILIHKVSAEMSKLEKLVEGHRDDIDQQLLQIRADINSLKKK